MAIDITLLWIIFDACTFLVVPYLFFKNKKFALMFFIGFLLTQWTIPQNRWIEYVFEVLGVMLILISCLKGFEK